MRHIKLKAILLSAFLLSFTFMLAACGKEGGGKDYGLIIVSKRITIATYSESLAITYKEDEQLIYTYSNTYKDNYTEIENHTSETLTTNGAILTDDTQITTDDTTILTSKPAEITTATNEITQTPRFIYPETMFGIGEEIEIISETSANHKKILIGEFTFVSGISEARKQTNKDINYITIAASEIYNANPNDTTNIVFVSLKTGKKYHSSQTCGSLNAVCACSYAESIDFGFDACSRCVH